ncbi:hypothetical protein ACFLY7_01670 [Patescibacteria group bacterium]
MIKVNINAKIGSDLGCFINCLEEYYKLESFFLENIFFIHQIPKENDISIQINLSDKKLFYTLIDYIRAVTKIIDLQENITKLVERQEIFLESLIEKLNKSESH